jgi:hypothetical protein
MGYRGSLTRGIKSPSKFITLQSGSSTLARFDQAIFEKIPMKGGLVKVIKGPTYDCDAFVNIPDRVFKQPGLESGPIVGIPPTSSSSTSSSEIVS